MLLDELGLELQQSDASHRVGWTEGRSAPKKLVEIGLIVERPNPRRDIANQFWRPGHFVFPFLLTTNQAVPKIEAAGTRHRGIAPSNLLTTEQSSGE